MFCTLSKQHSGGLGMLRSSFDAAVVFAGSASVAARSSSSSSAIGRRCTYESMHMRAVIG
jgi:hypothetical protein